MKPTDSEARIAMGKVIARCWGDDEYKSRLIDDPRAVLSEAGLDPPPDIEIKVQEQMPGQVLLTLPPRPDDEDMELDDSRLEAVAGGTWGDGWGYCW